MISKIASGIHHVIEDEAGVKKLYGGIYTEGMPVGDPSDYPDITYDTVYQELNELTGYQYSFKNAWYLWYKGMWIINTNASLLHEKW